MLSMAFGKAVAQYWVTHHEAMRAIMLSMAFGKAVAQCWVIHHEATRAIMLSMAFGKAVAQSTPHKAKHFRLKCSCWLVLTRTVFCQLQMQS